MCSNISIYFDGLFYKGSGIGRYYESLVKEFAKRNLNIYTCVPKNLKEHFMEDFKNVLENIRPIFVDYERFSVKGFFAQSKILKKLESELDLFFYPHINLPFYVPKNTLLTIHDLIPFTSYWKNNKIKRRIFKFYLNRALLKSKAIVTISNVVEKELREMISASQNKIYTIHEFIDDKFYNLNFNNTPIIKEKYILFVGNRKSHKNLENLIKAFVLLRDKISHKLVIAGTKDQKFDSVDILKNNLSLNDRILEFISPNDETIINLYQHADLFVFPSLFEGFGLPPLEALACGAPVIASDIPVLKEILGEKIACFNPYDIKDISKKILCALKNREYLLKIGREGLAFFNKEKIIRQYLELFDKAIKK